MLRAQQGGLALALTPLVLIGMNLIYAAGAYPFGKLADRMSHTRLLLWGLAVLVAADDWALASGTTGAGCWAAWRCGACTWA